MPALNLKDTLTVARFDYRNLVRSAPGVIFLILYLFIVWQVGAASVDMIPLGVKKSPTCELGKDHVATKVEDKVQQNIPPFSNVSTDTWRHMMCDRPVVMSVFFLIALFIGPPICLLLAFIQVGGYLHRKSIRYILPKTGRLELYLGLFLSNLKFFTVVSGAVTVIVTLGWILVGRDLSTIAVLGYSMRIFLALWLSSVPLIAFMAMVAGLVGSPGWTLLIGGLYYLLSDVIGYFMAKQSEYANVVFYLLPLNPKYWFAQPGVGPFLGAAVVMLLYTAGYLALGWVFLRRRNV
ncbi:MAG: hypothetical protein ABI333_11410 [bacterium]